MKRTPARTTISRRRRSPGEMLMLRASMRAKGKPFSRAWHVDRVERLWAELTRAMSVMRASCDHAETCLTQYRIAVDEAKALRKPRVTGVPRPTQKTRKRT